MKQGLEWKDLVLAAAAGDGTGGGTGGVGGDSSSDGFHSMAVSLNRANGLSGVLAAAILAQSLHRDPGYFPHK
jgi:hypothetical protein